MKAKQSLNIVYIGVIPGVKNLTGIPFRTDLAGMYHWDMEGCKYMCRINAGKNRYFFIEERYYFPHKPAGEKLGNILKIHYFNRELNQELPESTKRTRALLPFHKGRSR